MILKNKRHEKFALNIFKGMTQRDAYVEAGFKRRGDRANSTRLIANDSIWDRIQELHKMAESDAVMSVREVEERLSEIGRARLTDYTTCGPDRDLIDVGPESPNTAALQEITTRTEYDKDSAGVAVITKIKLHNPMTAMDMLIKRWGAYPPSRVEVDPGKTLEPILTALLSRLRGYGGKEDEHDSQ